MYLSVNQLNKWKSNAHIYFVNACYRIVSDSSMYGLMPYAGILQTFSPLKPQPSTFDCKPAFISECNAHASKFNQQPMD